MKDRNKAKKRIDFKSIKFKVWLSLMIFAVLIIGLLWVSQVIFLRYYTVRYKKNEFNKIAEELSSSYRGDYQGNYSRIANLNGCMVEVVLINNGDYFVDFSTNGLGYGSTGTTVLNKARFKNLLDALDEGTYFRKDSARSEYVFAEKLDDNSVLVLSQSTKVADSTVEILQTQMWIATITIIVLTFCISFIISANLSREISQLSEGAKKFANNDLTVEFSEKGSTEISEISSTLNYAVKEVSKVENLRRELIANVSHDLRTPLTLIKGYAEYMLDISGDNKEERDASLSIIIKETDRLSALVTDMLNLSKLEGGVEAEFDRVDISSLITDAVNSFSILNEKEGFDIRGDVKEGLFVYGDKQRLQTATYNLVGNAVNYTGEDKKVEVKLEEKDGKAVFSVSDSGEGISEENKALIWDRYYRAKEHKRNIAGSGLGLSIVKKVLELHNAEYGVDSEKGKGSRFWYALDLEEKEKEK